MLACGFHFCLNMCLKCLVMSVPFVEGGGRLQQDEKVERSYPTQITFHSNTEHVHISKLRLIHWVQTQGTTDVGIICRTQNAGVTQRVGQHFWRTWIGELLSRDPSSDWETSTGNITYPRPPEVLLDLLSYSSTLCSDTLSVCFHRWMLPFQSLLLSPCDVWEFSGCSGCFPYSKAVMVWWLIGFSKL